MMNQEFVQFGRYPQTAQGSVMPIEWQIMERNGDRVLLLARNILDAQPFHDEAYPVRWEDSSLRTWLNKVFLNEAFTAQEQAMLAEPAQEEDPAVGAISWQLLCLETATEAIADRVFLLNHADIIRLFPSENSMFCPGASAQASDHVEAECWWLRSSMNNAPMAFIVSPCDSVGISVISPENMNGVRPAVWVRAELLNE